MPAVHRYGSARRLYIMPQTAGSLIPGHPVTTLKEYCLIGLLFMWGNSPMAPVYEKKDPESWRKQGLDWNHGREQDRTADPRRVKAMLSR